MKLIKLNVVNEADEDYLLAEAEAADGPKACYETKAAIETDVAVAGPAVAAAVVASAECGNLGYKSRCCANRCCTSRCCTSRCCTSPYISRRP